jgi:hypothetical protein
MKKIEEERMKLSETALDFVTLREGLGQGVTAKEIWGAYFIGISEDEVGISSPQVNPEEQPTLVEEQTVAPEAVVAPEPIVTEQKETNLEEQPTLVEEQTVTPEPVVAPESIVTEQKETNLEEQPTLDAEPTVTPEQTELYGRLANAINVRADSLKQAEVNPEKQPTLVEEPTMTPEPAVAPESIVTEQKETNLEGQPTLDAEPTMTPEPAVAPESVVDEQPVVKEPSESDDLLSGIDNLRTRYRDELNDGYNYTEEQKKEWEDARLAEDISLKDTNLSYDEQENTVLSYEQGLKDQRNAVAEMENQLAIIKAAEQKIAELSKKINPDLLKQVKSENAVQQVNPEVEPEGFSR